MAAAIYSYSVDMFTLTDILGARVYPYSVDMFKTFDVAAESVGVASYVNSVWDTQKSGSDKTHYWKSSPEPDVNGTYYDGPGTWGVHTSGFSTKKLSSTISVEEDTGAESNLWTPPENPHSYNEEFDQSTLDSAWYNYSGQSADYGTISYDTVDPYDASYITGDELRVTLNPDTRRSWALMQPPNSRWMYLGRIYTFPTNVLIVARMKFLHFYNTSTSDSDRNIAIWLMSDSAGKPDPANRVNMYLNDINSNTIRPVCFKTVGGSDTDVTSATNTAQQGQAIEYVAVHKIGTTYHGWVGTASGNWIWMGSFTHSTTMAHVGIFMSNSTINKPGVGCFGIDFIRFYETDNFLL